MDLQALGRFLRENRELKEISVDDAVNALKIRRSILESFEMGDFSVSESPVQLRGMLRNYARYLGLEEDRVLELYERALRTPPRRKGARSTQEIRAPRKITDTPPAMPTVKLKEPRSRNGNGRSVLVALFILMFSLVAIGVIIYVIIEFVRTPDDTQFVADAPTSQNPLLGTLLPSATYTLTWTPRPTQPTATMPFTGPLAGDQLTIDINPSQRVWINILGDGDTLYAGILRPQEQRTFTATSRLDVIASNAAALDIVFNGQPQGRFGLHGQQVNLVFTSQGVAVQKDDTLFEPTPENSPTPLPTPTEIASTAIARLTPTATEGPSPTPSDTPTLTETPSLTPIPSITPSPTLTATTTLTPTQTQPPTATPLPSATPTITPIPSATNTPAPTAILPPRVTATGQPATKAP